jgi:hypothetical protein
MNCYYCKNKLTEDFLGTCCPNEQCNSIDGIILAKIFSDGTKYWYKNGELHREDGPAIKYPNGYTERWLNGKKIK